MRRTSIPLRKHRRIISMLKSGHGILKTAKTVGVGTRTVQRRAEDLREPAEEVEFRKICRKCPVHGLVAVWPCVACEAKKQRGIGG